MIKDNYVKYVKRGSKFNCSDTAVNRQDIILTVSLVNTLNVQISRGHDSTGIAAAVQPQP